MPVFGIGYLYLLIFLEIMVQKLLNYKQYAFTIIIKIIALIILLLVFENSYQIFKGFLFAQILMYVAVNDYKTRIIPDKVHVLIMLLGFWNINILESVIGFLLVPLPYLIVATTQENSVGGGDIKLMASCGFLLGTKMGFFAGLIGLTLAVIINSTVCKIKKIDRSRSFALGPYLCFGCFIVFLIH